MRITLLLLAGIIGLILYEPSKPDAAPVAVPFEELTPAVAEPTFVPEPEVAPAPAAPPQAPITILIPPAKPRAKPVVARQAVYYGGCVGGSCAPQRLRLYVRKPTVRTQQAASGDCTDGSCGTSQQSYSSGGSRPFRGGFIGRLFGR